MKTISIGLAQVTPKTKKRTKKAIFRARTIFLSFTVQKCENEPILHKKRYRHQQDHTHGFYLFDVYIFTGNYTRKDKKMEQLIKELEKMDKRQKEWSWLTEARTEDIITTELIKSIGNIVQNDSTVEYWHISRFFRVLLKECPAIYYYLYSRGYLGEVKQLLNFAFYEGMKYQQSRKEPANENYK